MARMTTDPAFYLVRANKSRGGGGHWSDEDFDVFDHRHVIGRIMRHPQAPEGQPWFWTITARGRRPSLADRGYAASREDAMADFKTMWFAEELVCTRIVDLLTPAQPSFIARCVHCNAQIWVTAYSPRTMKRVCQQCAKPLGSSHSSD